MAGRRLGMYVHAHWGYNHPYAARTWTVDDWRGYASGLRALGYDLVMIWPMLETMPDPPTPSDLAYLRKIGSVIDMLQSDFGMTVLITVCPNTIASERAADYTFEERPYFGSDVRLNPGDADQVDMLMRQRRNHLSYLNNADGIAVIDSDPGGYIGSTNEEFAQLLVRYQNLILDLNPRAKLYYWMLMGWEAYSRFWQQVNETGVALHTHSPSDCEYAVRALMQSGSDQWGVLACNPAHLEIADRLGIRDRAICFPYGLVEGEPTYPLTVCSPDTIAEWLAANYAISPYQGAMANAQTHVVQLPNTYLFAHFAQGGTADAVDLRAFANELLPGLGEAIADAWEALTGSSSAAARGAIECLGEAASRDISTGRCSGLLLGGPERFLTDLALQLHFRADMLDFINSPSAGSLAALAESWGAWVERTGFVDAYGGPYAAELHAALRNLGSDSINNVLDDFDNWRDPSVRHGIIPRLLHAIGTHVA